MTILSKSFVPVLCVLMMSVAAFGQKHSAPPPPPKAAPAAAAPVGKEISTGPVPKAVPNGPSEPLSAFRMDLLTIRDNPSELTDKRLAEFTREQVGAEQTEWQELDTEIKDSQKRRGGGLRPNTFEWEKLVQEQPDFARGSLLDVFMRTDASWSFVQHPDSSIVMAFIFSREHVQGRQQEFAAQELLPVSRKFLQLATSKESNNLWLVESLPPWQYDFATKSIKFGSGPVHILKPVFDPVGDPTGDREYFDELPGAAHGEADMWIGPPQGDRPEVKPGAHSGSPSELWRSKFSFLRLPSPTVIALDHQLRIASVPLAPAAAEQLQKLGNTLQAKVYITADRMEPIHELHPERVNGPTMILFAHLQKVEIVNARGAVVAVLAAGQLPQPTPIPKAAPVRSVEQERRQQKADAQEAVANRAAATQDHLAKERICRKNASNAAGSSSGAHFSDVYNKCMEEDSPQIVIVNPEREAAHEQSKKRIACRQKAKKEAENDPNVDRVAAFKKCMSEGE